jgi:hypothetical protein
LFAIVGNLTHQVKENSTLTSVYVDKAALAQSEHDNLIQLKDEIENLNGTKFRPQDNKVSAPRTSVQNAVIRLRDNFEFLMDSHLKLDGRVNSSGDGAGAGSPDLVSLET